MMPHPSLGGPGGGGKSTIARRLIKRWERWGAIWVPRITTRSFREGEDEGLEYGHRTPEEFREMVKGGEILLDTIEIHETRNHEKYLTAVQPKRYWPITPDRPAVSVFGAVAPVVKRMCAPEMITIYLDVSEEEFNRRLSERGDGMSDRWSLYPPESVKSAFDFVIPAEVTRDAIMRRVEEIVEEVTGVKLVG